MVNDTNEQQEDEIAFLHALGDNARRNQALLEENRQKLLDVAMRGDLSQDWLDWIDRVSVSDCTTGVEEQELLSRLLRAIERSLEEDSNRYRAWLEENKQWQLTTDGSLVRFNAFSASPYKLCGDKVIGPVKNEATFK